MESLRRRGRKHQSDKQLSLPIQPGHHKLILRGTRAQNEGKADRRGGGEKIAVLSPPTSMLAALLRAPNSVEANPLILADIPKPSPREHEICLQVHCCAICRTDLHTVEGELPLPKLPVVPGHQIVGIVEALGRGVKRFKEGDRAGVAWLRHTCGSCRYCRDENENLCDRAEFTGLQADGGYAQWTTVHEAFAYSLPSAFSDRQAAPLLCAGVIGYRALRLSEVRK
ncbi:hypothetical protein EPO44_13510, partial [bacterium]